MLSTIYDTSKPWRISFKWKGERSWLLNSSGKVLYAEVAKNYSKNKFIYEITKKEKEIHTSFEVTHEIAWVTAKMHDKCLVKRENASNLLVKEMNRKFVLALGTCCARNYWTYRKTYFKK